MHLARIIGHNLVLCALIAAAGCSPFRPKTDRSPLQKPQMSPDSVTLDVFFIRCPFGDSVANEELWQQIDEQQIPLETRRRLAANGLRAGVISGQLPICLSQMLQLDEKAAPPGGPQTAEVSEIGSDEAPLWSHKAFQPGKRGEIVTSDIYPELPVLLSGPDGVSGKNYKTAKGVFAVKVAPQKDGRVMLEIVPELHHGDIQRNYSGSQGAWRVEMHQPRLAFDDMAISACLSAGQMVVLSCLPNRQGSLGHNFLTTDSSGSLEQKLVVLRLAQTQHDELLDPMPLTLDQVQ